MTTPKRSKKCWSMAKRVMFSLKKLFLVKCEKKETDVAYKQALRDIILQVCSNRFHHVRSILIFQSTTAHIKTLPVKLLMIKRVMAFFLS